MGCDRAAAFQHIACFQETAFQETSHPARCEALAEQSRSASQSSEQRAVHERVKGNVCRLDIFKFLLIKP